MFPTGKDTSLVVFYFITIIKRFLKINVSVLQERIDQISNTATVKTSQTDSAHFAFSSNHCSVFNRKFGTNYTREITLQLDNRGGINNEGGDV